VAKGKRRPIKDAVKGSRGRTSSSHNARMAGKPVYSTGGQNPEASTDRAARLRRIASGR
jgi:hypothetical protein